MEAVTIRYSHRLFARLIRAGEWWDYKLVPIFAAFYATALMLRVSVQSIWISAVMLLIALVPGAMYVSVINDVTDVAEDLAAGKANRIVGRSRALVAALIAIPVAAGIAISIYWRHERLLLSCYLAAWAAFSLYSLPPFRFKTRGILGVLCDAGGAHLFPTLVAVVLACRGAQRPVPPLWLAAAGAWAFGYGLRGILWHQLTDRDNDRSAAVRTFAERHAPEVAARLGTFVAFPLELAGLGAMLWLMWSIWPLAFLAAYAVLVMLRVARWEMNVVVVRPKPRFLIILHEFHDTFFPVALLLASRDFLVLAVHLLMFHARGRQTLRDAAQLWRERRLRRA